MRKILSKRKRFRTTSASLAIKKHGRVILNRPAASFFEDLGFGKVILYWDDNSHILTVQGVRSHPEEHVVYYGGAKNIPAAFSAKTALNSIGYDFSENRTYLAKIVPEESAIEVRIPPEHFLPNAPALSQRVKTEDEVFY